MQKTIRLGPSRGGRKPGTMGGFSRRDQGMMQILNAMSRNGASDLALVVMINECRREETCKKKKQQKVLIRTSLHESFGLESFTATSAGSSCL